MISVCMATYNGERYIRRQVDSILSQLGPDDELVISDDGSTDRTIAVLEEINDFRIRIIFNKRRKGVFDPVQRVTHNFENALKAAKGDFIFISDQDDVWAENKIEVMMRWLRDYDYVQSDCHIVDVYMKEREDLRGSQPKPCNRWKALVGAAPYMGCVTAISRRLLDKALPFPPDLQSHDRWLGFLASFLFSIKFIPEKLIYYRKHDSNVSSTFGKSLNPISYRVRTRLYYMRELAKRILFKK